ncbi:hypothetical protein CKAH01_07817 [Colletotrichum kahawae]|uniref:Uncharacterized protein n=1 Tax=Colletotrichum kahawae TaxID=34407 RepID=A0AAD9Y5D2_COLKA|nr:hypothetical protein CKAH01_07817 [Colletotrichum kahawae]
MMGRWAKQILPNTSAKPPTSAVPRRVAAATGTVALGFMSIPYAQHLDNLGRYSWRVVLGTPTQANNQPPPITVTRTANRPLRTLIRPPVAGLPLHSFAPPSGGTPTPPLPIVPGVPSKARVEMDGPAFHSRNPHSSLANFSHEAIDWCFMLPVSWVMDPAGRDSDEVSPPVLSADWTLTRPSVAYRLPRHVMSSANDLLCFAWRQDEPETPKSGKILVREMVEGDGYGDGNRDGAARVWIIGQISLTWDPHALLTAFGRGGSHNVQLASAANGRRAFSIAHSDQPALRNFYQFAVTAEVETCQISYLQARFRFEPVAFS